MQRRDAVDCTIRIGALLEQKVGERALPGEDCKRQRMRAVRSGVIDACACGKQDLRRLDVAVLGGSDQR